MPLSCEARVAYFCLKIGINGKPVVSVYLRIVFLNLTFLKIRARAARLLFSVLDKKSVSKLML
jgi:hypothetical protein